MLAFLIRLNFFLKLLTPFSKCSLEDIKLMLVINVTFLQPQFFPLCRKGSLFFPTPSRPFIIVFPQLFPPFLYVSQHLSSYVCICRRRTFNIHIDNFFYCFCTRGMLPGNFVGSFLSSLDLSKQRVMNLGNKVGIQEKNLY